MVVRPRDSLLIIRDILAAAASRAATKTEIVYRSNINFLASERYVAKLLLRGLLETVRSDDGRVRFRTTALGLSLLSKLSEVERMVEGPPAYKGR